LCYGFSFKKRKIDISAALGIAQTAVLNRCGFNKADQVGCQRFMNNERVLEKDLLADLVAPCLAHPPVDHVLVIQDTSQYNFDTFEGRFADDDEHIGVLGDNKTLGLFAHTALAVDAGTGIPIGFADLKLYQYASQRMDKKERKYQSQPIEEKSSYRWLEVISHSAERLPSAAKITVIADREADIYQFLAVPRDERVELLVRSSHNRKLVGGDKLHARLDGMGWIGSYQLELKNDRRRKGKPIDLSVRYTEVELLKSSSVVDPDNRYPATQKVNVVEVLELSPPPGIEPIHWYLYTTHPVNSLVDALCIIQWYVQRWWIEDFFRLTKRKGFELEESQLRSGAALKRLIHLVFEQALKVLVLRQGRLQVNVTLVSIFSEPQIRLLKHLNSEVEGQSSYQQNPFSPKTLAWGSWVIARLGGWTAQPVDKRPAGVITLIRGYRRFKDMELAFYYATKPYSYDNDV
jgi:hypothetical protein